MLGGKYANKKANPFDECPVYETKHFTYALVNADDAEDLFVVYSDQATLGHMNNDNCPPGEWRPTVDELKTAWRRDYELRHFLRWSIRDKEIGKVIGTVEIAPLPWGRWFFGKEPPIGILRLDLLSIYERESIFTEIIGLMGSELANDFEVNQVIMKAPPDEPERVNALIANNFHPHSLDSFPYNHYYEKYILVV
jgi:hypothetical protein